MNETVELDFLLESLRNLDIEHEGGALTDDEYEALRNEQTLRAAELLRHQNEVTPEPDAANEPRRRARPRRPLVIAFVLVALIVCGLALVTATDSRLGGDEITGSVASDTNTLLQRAREETAKGRPADAVKTYDKVLARDQRNAEALAYKGWLVRLAGLPAEGLRSIDLAIAADPQYPDAHFFKGFILLRDRSDPSGAVTEFESFLAHDPPADMVPLVNQALADARAQASKPLH